MTTAPMITGFPMTSLTFWVPLLSVIFFIEIVFFALMLTLPELSFFDFSAACALARSIALV